MLDNNLINELLDAESTTLQILLSSIASKATIDLQTYIDMSLTQGISRETLKRQLIADLNEGGRIFGVFRKAIKATGNGSINRIRDAGNYGEYGIDKLYRWAAVFVNTCPDCIARHNEEPKTWEEWEAEGLPRAGATVCESYCRCVLVPAEFSRIEPVQVEKRK